MSLPRCVSVWTSARVVALCASLITPAYAIESSRAGVDGTNTSVADSASLAYAKATALVDEGRYAEALAAYRRLQKDYPGFKRLPAVQTRIAVLLESSDAGPALAVFMDALERRDAGDVDSALVRLETLVAEHADSTLVDDALYLTAYFAVMDRYDFERARETLLVLGRRFPDSAYRDSAVYLDAIALEQLGRTSAARTALETLRERHTALALPFDFRWPAGGVMSRYWFDRAERRLDIIGRRLSDASTLRSRGRNDDGKLRLDVNVGGADMTLLLTPGSLVRETAWLDAGLADRSPPPLGVYEGTVVGHEDSWVRAVVQNDAITGLVEINGERHRLLPANLVGTLDYYKPKPSSDNKSGDGSSLAEVLRDIDALEPPPALGGARELQVSGEPALGAARSEVRAVPLSIVVDSQYDRYHAGAGLASALNDLNVADGIYRSFGLSLSLDEVLTFDAERDPMAIGPVPLETLLRNFRDYRLAQKTLFEGSALTYLFSGNPKTDVTLGLAWIDTLCRTDGYDVGVTTPSEFGDVLLTHELGHSLGAQHDSDTACAGDSSYLMWPNISSRTPTTLSTCSADSVRRSYERQCLLDTIDLSLSIVDEGDSARLMATNNDTSLVVDATLIVETGQVHRETWPDGCRESTPTSARCAFDGLAPGESRSVNITHAAGEPVIGILSADGVAELTVADNQAALDGLLVADRTATSDGSTSQGGDGRSGDDAFDKGAILGGSDPGLASTGGTGTSGPWVWLALLSGVGRFRVAGVRPDGPLSS